LITSGASAPHLTIGKNMNYELTIQEIVETIAEEYQLPVNAVLEKRQYPELVWARRKAMHEALEMGYPKSEIADFFNLDDSTVSQGVKVFKADLESGRRMKNQESHERYEKIVSLSRSGVPPKKISTDLNVKYTTVTSIIRRARVRGDVPSFLVQRTKWRSNPRSLRDMIRAHGTRLGSTSEMMESHMSKEVREYFVNISVKSNYSCVVECMADYLTDIYFNETQKES